MAKMNVGQLNTLHASPPLRASLPQEKSFDCGIHQVTYKAFRAGCPVCQAERQVEEMRNAMKQIKGQLELLTEENRRMRVQIDVVSAMREAALLLDDNDLEFLKIVLYQWRDTKALGLKTTHGTRKKGQKRGTILPANGFIVMPRQGEPYGHLCTSVGGVAIAEYFDEAMNSVGSAQAMAWLVKGLANQLPGTVVK